MLFAALAWCVFLLAVVPALLFFWNLLLYRKPPIASERSPVSVLIPARDEELSIELCIRAALASVQVDLEVIVLDDHSEDSTAEIVERIAAEDSRLRLVAAPPLPPGWCGKQFACWILAGLASNPNLCFIDADVQLTPDGVSQMLAAMSQEKVALISGFPRQVTLSALEQLLLPLMHFLLLGYLPLFGMRNSLNPSFGAGCGQIFVADREAYFKAGGHQAIRNSRHDGLTLPKAFRRAGFMSGLCDATSVASCRMYHSAREVFWGLLKNADEGLAAPSRILPFSFVLCLGQCLPLLVFFRAWEHPPTPLMDLAAIAVVASYLPRLTAVVRFEQPLAAALLHPLAIFSLLGIQWYAFLRSLLRLPATWKGRRYSSP